MSNKIKLLIDPTSDKHVLIHNNTTLFYLKDPVELYVDEGTRFRYNNDDYVLVKDLTNKPLPKHANLDLKNINLPTGTVVYRERRTNPSITIVEPMEVSMWSDVAHVIVPPGTNIRMVNKDVSFINSENKNVQLIPPPADSSTITQN